MAAGREEGQGPIKLWWQKMKEKNHDNESNKVISKHFTFFVWKVAHMDMKSKCKAKSTYFTQKCNRTTTKHTFSPWLFSLLFSSFPLSCFSNKKTTTNKHKKKKRKKKHVLGEVHSPYSTFGLYVCVSTCAYLRDGLPSTCAASANQSITIKVTPEKPEA